MYYSHHNALSLKEMSTDQEMKIHHVFQELIFLTTTYIKVHYDFSAVWPFKTQFFSYIHSPLLLDYETSKNRGTLTLKFPKIKRRPFHLWTKKIKYLQCKNNVSKIVNCNVLKLTLVTFSKLLFVFIIISLFLPHSPLSWKSQIINQFKIFHLPFYT
jgi:hypothetical protein